MYAKLKDGNISQFPYTIGQLRKDNPNVSFPKNITDRVLQKYGVVGVVEGPQPTLGKYQRVQRDALPKRPLLGVDSDGTENYAGYWMIHYTAVDMFADTTDEEGNVTTKAEHEAAYQVTLDEQAATANRKKRDDLLAETDWVVIKSKETGTTLTTAWKTYRQALRDITDHENFPYLNDDDWPVKP